MTKRLKFIIIGTIIGVAIGLVTGWFLSILLIVPLILFLMSDLPQPWNTIQEKIAIIVGIISWVLIILGGFIGGKLGWRRSKGEPTRILNELKLKNLLPLFIILVGVGTILTIGGRAWSNLPSPKIGQPLKVVITTDKTEYEQGEAVKITVRNDLKGSIFGHFVSCGNRPFWGLQRFENGRWEEFNFSFPNLTKGGCDFILCEKTEPGKLRAGLEIEDSWPLTNICEWSLEPIGAPKTESKPINKGIYRVFLIYGLNTDGFNLIESKAIYSNEFTIGDPSKNRSSLSDCRDARVGCEAQVPKEEGTVSVESVYKKLYEGISCEEWDRKCRWYVPGE